MLPFNIHLLETPEDMSAVEEIQRAVWPGSETDIVPAHMLITAVHNGGLVLGAFNEDKMIGFVFGFPGLDKTPDGPRPKHCSHMMGIHPDHRDAGVGFALKRAQWQMVRHQGLDHITWTYDPLLSRNAYLNIAKLGAVASIYRRSEYGEILALKSVDFGLARDWRFFTREFFETAFKLSYIVTDFVFDTTEGRPRGLYVLTHGESTLEQFE